MTSPIRVRRLLIAAYGLLAMLLLGALCVPQAHAQIPDPNIIGIADNATSCGGATLCSTNGTTGYNGAMAFDLSTIESWFQIDSCSGTMGQNSCSPAGGTSLLPGQPAQTMNAGDFLVVNDTGHIVTSFSLTLNDSFTANTSGVTTGSGSPNNNGACGVATLCMNFQIHGGAANYFSNVTLNGPNCVTSCGTDSANFTPGQVTYTWNAGTDGGIPVGATFDINFASWNNDVAPGTVPEPASMTLLGAGLLAVGGVFRKRARRA